MFPALTMSVGHLRFQEASEAAVDGPSDSVALLDSALDHELVPGQAMDIDPHAILQNFVGLSFGHLVLHEFCASWFAPEFLRAAVRMLAPSPGPDRQLRQVIVIESHKFFWRQNDVRFVEPILHHSYARVGHLL